MSYDVQPSAPHEAGRAMAPGAPSPGYLRVIRVVDRFTELSGKIFAWLVVPMVGGLVYEVLARYLFHAPTVWAYDITYMLYGSLFMLGSAYTLYRKAHIRTDLLYRLFPVRVQGTIDTICYLFLFFPGMLFFLIAGWDYAAHSWVIGEKAGASPWGVAIYPFKTVIPVAAFLLLIQGMSEFL
ncbi:MAG: TRAP transporter small permease subunit, partial [Chloroflexota bacterium]